MHRAVLRNGSSVAIKVQRPNVRQKLKTDLRLLRLFAQVIDFLPIFKDDFDSFVEEFRFWTMRELDYLLEASNSKVFSDLYTNNPD
ncbi:AarF/ABC1/UbiB kinase family protein, partial [Candidatus Dojkabacteria bacterium]|nr:AarF/ABC1/UbiB kinase family protein [Candidatus Dojkabacteria bacterium]